jgi:predicted nucleic acid-binding protein
MSLACVLDASVVVGLYVPQPWSDQAMAFVEAAIRSRARLAAPDALYYETAGALRKYALARGRGAPDATLANLTTLVDLRIETTSCRDLTLEAADISQRHVVSVYDAFYLALSARLGVPLVTADERLVGAVAGKGFDVRHVADIEN